jgi:atypical dual specificity phosphatase
VDPLDRPEKHEKNRRHKRKRLAARLLFPPTFAWNILLGRLLKIRPWWSEIEKGLFLGARPLRRDVARLAQIGVRGVVNTCEEYCGPVDLYEQHGIEQLWIPTTDFQPPSLESIMQGVTFIEKHLSDHGGVYVHCKAGRARSATIVLCWMLKARGMSRSAAQKKLLQLRPHVNSQLMNRDVVIAYETYLNQQPEQSHSPES